MGSTGTFLVERRLIITTTIIATITTTPTTTPTAIPIVFPLFPFPPFFATSELLHLELLAEKNIESFVPSIRVSMPLKFWMKV